MGENKEIKVEIRRFNPNEDEESYLQSYQIPFEPGRSVLGVLNYIYENIDSSLGFYASCRIGKCKGCHVVVNGEVKMACTTMVDGDVKLEPLPGNDVIKDLLVERK